jgi:hypothetical protein
MQRRIRKERFFMKTSDHPNTPSNPDLLHQAPGNDAARSCEKCGAPIEKDRSAKHPEIKLCRRCQSMAITLDLPPESRPVF